MCLLQRYLWQTILFDYLKSIPNLLSLADFLLVSWLTWVSGKTRDSFSQLLFYILNIGPVFPSEDSQGICGHILQVPQCPQLTWITMHFQLSITLFQLREKGSPVHSLGFHHASMWSQFPDTGIKPAAPATVEGRVPTTGSLGKASFLVPCLHFNCRPVGASKQRRRWGRTVGKAD